MKHHFSFLIVALFSVGSLLAQETVLSKKHGTAEAFVKSSFSKMVQDEKRLGPEEKIQIKKPNPFVYHPDFEILPESVVSMEAATEKESHRAKQLSPSPDTTFMGLYDTGNTIPPDVNGAPGPDHLMVTLNTEVRIQERDGTPLSTVSLGLFWAELPGSDTFDPKILYDFEADRWIFVTPSSSTIGQSRLYMGVSATSDPTGEWYLYSFLTDEDGITWFDYPSMGFNSKWIVVSGNMFGNDFYRTVFVFDKQAMYDGLDTPQYTRFATSQGFTLVPAITYDTDEENVYLVSSANGNQGGNGYISLFKVSGPLENPDFNMVGNIGTPNPWAGNVNGSGDFLPQLGTTELLNAVDHRMENVVMRNNKLWAVHHVFLPANNPSRTAVQWWEISPEGELLQRGRVDDPSGVMSYAFASISVNIYEDVMIGHGSFSENQYASSAYSFRSHADEPNTLRDPFLYKAGLAPYYKTFGSGRNRWGDYTATMLDPVNGIDFWVLQEYAELPNGGDRWGTWWAYVKVAFQPIVDFSTVNTTIPTGESVDFKDLTLGVPDAWNWTFDGAENGQSNLQNPTGITYPTEGTYNVSLTASNEYGDGSTTKEAYITVSSTILPEIHFSYNQSFVCTNDIVQFTDESLYLPREWHWEFTPSTVSFVNGTTAFSQNPQVTFDQPGLYSVTLNATNLNGSSSRTLFEVISAGGTEIPYIQYFDTDSFDAASWIVDNPDDDITWELVDVAGLDMTTKAASIDFRHYYAIGQRDRLISPPLNLQGFDHLNLSFRHAYAKRLDEVADSLIVLVSDDCGASWKRIFADAENGTGNFATHPQAEGFVPESSDDWCGGSFGPDCIVLNMNEFAGKADVKVAFETFSFYGNPIYITDVELGPTVDVEENQTVMTNLSVYPNPAHDKLVINTTTGSKIRNLVIYSASGQEVMRRNSWISGRNLDISHLSPGVYFVEAETDQNTERLKLIIQ